MKMKKGFTLIEIMIVVAIIAILAAIAIPNFISYRRTSQEKACEANKKTIENAVEAYLVNNSTASTVTTAILKSQGLLKEEPTCPIDGKGYEVKITNDGTVKANVTVTCKGSHSGTTQASTKPTT